MSGVRREGVITTQKSTNVALLDAQFAGKNARFSAHSDLLGARRRLARAGEAGLVRDIDAVLQETRSAGADPEALATQLDQLGGLIAIEVVSRSVPDAEALTSSLATIATAIRIASAAKARRPGTPEHTEHLDLVDGVIVELCRTARAAARAAARALGQPSIAKAFELTVLYGGSRHGPTEDSGPTGPTL